LLALGGFAGDEKGLNTIENSEKVTSAIAEYLNKNSYAIIPVNGGLQIVPIDTSTQKPWWKFW